MGSPQFAGRVREHFRYFLEDLGFVVIREDCYAGESEACAVLLESADCRIRVMKSLDQVLVDVGPLSAPEDARRPATELWFDLQILSSFVTGGADTWEYELSEGPLDQAIERGLERAVAKLREHWELICPLFRKGVFEQKQKELVHAKWQRARARRAYHNAGRIDSQRMGRLAGRAFVVLGVVEIALAVLVFLDNPTPPETSYGRTGEALLAAGAILLLVASWLVWTRRRLARKSSQLALVPLVAVMAAAQGVAMVTHSAAAWLVSSLAAGLVMYGIGLDLIASSAEEPEE